MGLGTPTIAQEGVKTGSPYVGSLMVVKTSQTLVFQAPGIVVRLFPDQTCSHPKVVALIKEATKQVPELAKIDFFQADVIYEGKKIEACWTLLKTGEVFIVDETNDQGYIPINLLKPETAI
jgi:hypothetical protein